MSVPLLTPVPQLDNIWRFEAGTVGYLIVRGNRSLLIDCPAPELAAAVAAARLPAPEVILHTQVQEEHCRDWAAFPQAKVYVAESARDLATLSPAFCREAKTVWGAARDWSTRGEEKYGVAGALTERPPTRALNVAGVLRPGDTFRWEDVELTVIPLPGSGKRSIGLHWAAAGACFTGDLIRAGGFLVNIYDLERNYALMTGWREADASLARLQALNLRLALPSTGPVLTDFATDAARLRPLLVQRCQPQPRRAAEPAAPVSGPPLRVLSERWREVVPGIYQNCNWGNMILYVDAAGRGLLVDPDFCYWEGWEKSCAGLHADFDLLERETGLQRLDRILFTHYHGDHVQNAGELRERYGARVGATPEVAELVEYPERYGYVALVNWYGFPFASIKVDERLVYDREYVWADTTFMPVHTPGHCYAHAGYIIPWQGHRTYCASDVVQYGTGPLGAALPVAYNDTPWPKYAARVTFRRMAELRPDLILGGHSHYCFDPDGGIMRDLLAVAGDCMANVRAILHDGDLRRAMTPPGFDAMRPPLATGCSPHM